MPICMGTTKDENTVPFVIVGLDPTIQSSPHPLDSRSRIKYGTSFAGMTVKVYFGSNDATDI